MGTVSFGTSSNALGPSDTTYNDNSAGSHVVSLGDGGSITLTFNQPITNGSGADFAVFENGFSTSSSGTADFLELATVAVSSDGINFFTFPSVSLTQTGTQVGGSGTLNPANLYNLAGSALAGYGTPFDLSDLANDPDLASQPGFSSLNLNDITAIRITDVVGSISSTYGTMDDQNNAIFNGTYGTINNLINDPFPTPFSSSGFDLDAVGIINVVPEPSPVWYLLLGLGALTFVRHYLLNKPKT